MMGLTEIRRRKFQFALITLLVTLIAYLILMISGLGIGLNEQAGSALRGLDADALAYASNSDLSVIRSELGAGTVEQLSRMEGVTDWAPLGYVGAKVTAGLRSPQLLDEPLKLGFESGVVGQG